MFRNVKELFKSKQNWFASLTMCIELEKENRLAVACLENKMKFSLELIKINGINFFRIKHVSKLQGVVQIQPNSISEF